MRQIRNSVFETNSSSSHSVSIGPVKKKEVNKNIPRNITLYEVPEYEVANGHENRTVSNTLMTEVSKLSFLFNLVATCIRNEYEDYNDYIVTTFSCLCGRAVSESDPADQRKAVSQDLIYMRWLREMVQEETGTLIKNTQFQDKFVVSQPPRIGPIIGANNIPTPKTATPFPCSSGGNDSNIIACEIGNKHPPPNPCNILPNIIISKFSLFILNSIYFSLNFYSYILFFYL